MYGKLALVIVVIIVISGKKALQIGKLKNEI
jgi:hypothetical protein